MFKANDDVPLLMNALSLKWWEIIYYYTQPTYEVLLPSDRFQEDVVVGEEVLSLRAWNEKEHIITLSLLTKYYSREASADKDKKIW